MQYLILLCAVHLKLLFSLLLWLTFPYPLPLHPDLWGKKSTWQAFLVVLSFTGVRFGGWVEGKGLPQAAGVTSSCCWYRKRWADCPNITKAILWFKSVCLAVYGWHTAVLVCHWHMLKGMDWPHFCWKIWTKPPITSHFKSPAFNSVI